MTEFNWQSFGAGQAGDSLANMLGAMFGRMNWKNPGTGMNQYFNQMPGILEKYYGPYAQAGQKALPQLQHQYGNLMANPTGEMNQIGQGYHQSPGFKFSLNQAENAMNNAAAAGGMAGSPADQQRRGQVATQLGNQDYYNYVDRGLHQYDTGLQGESDLAHMGEQASEGLGDSLVNELMSRLKMQYANQQNQNEHKGGFWGSLFGGAGDLLGAAGMAGWL